MKSLTKTDAMELSPEFKVDKAAAIMPMVTQAFKPAGISVQSGTKSKKNVIQKQPNGAHMGPELNPNGIQVGPQIAAN